MPNDVSRFIDLLAYVRTEVACGRMTLESAANHLRSFELQDGAKQRYLLP